MQRFGFVLVCFSTLLPMAFTQACTSTMDDCSNTSTCAAGGGAAKAGSSGSTNGGKAGNSAAGTSNSGEGGASAGGSNAGSGGSSAMTGGAGANGAGDAGAGGVVTLPCDGACAAPKPVCDEPNDTCVECLGEADCAAGVKKKCDTDAKACVTCLASTDCPTAASAKCDGGACVKCTNDDDCTHIAGKGVCDGGTCVQCTVTDESACVDNSCNPSTKSCTSTATGSVGPCEPCLADSECIGGNKADPDARCVPLKFGATLRPRGFCLRREAKTCSKPFSTLATTVSLSGATSEDYCGIDQESVRCEAVLDLLGSAECGDAKDTSCGCSARDQQGNCTATGAGGLCRKVGAFTNRCTYSCGVTDDCPGGKTCTLAEPYCH